VDEFWIWQNRTLKKYTLLIKIFLRISLSFKNIIIAVRDMLEKKSLSGRDFFQRPPAPSHEIFFWAIISLILTLHI